MLNSKQAFQNANMEGLYKLLTEEQLRALQLTLLEMYLDIAKVCKTHNIVPFLIGGSALGAIRHNGFIPWDDDLDVGMTREDYECFKQVFEAELSDRYILNAPNYSVNPRSRFPVVLKKGTVYKSFDSFSSELQKVYLDIFIIENVPDSKLLFWAKGIYCNFLEFVSGKVAFYENINEVSSEIYMRVGKAFYYSSMLIGRLFSWKKAAKWFEAIDRHAQYSKPSKHVAIATGRKHYFGEVFRREQFLPPIYVTFEDHRVPVFPDYDHYLKNLYHDYMVLPPEEKREHHGIREMKL